MSSNCSRRHVRSNCMVRTTSRSNSSSMMLVVAWCCLYTATNFYDRLASNLVTAASVTTTQYLVEHVPTTITQQLQRHNQAIDDDEDSRHDGSESGKDVEVIIEDPFNENRDLLTVGGFVESDVCWMNLDASDLDMNDEVSPDEYVTFAKLQTEVLPEDIQTYDDLPLVFRLAFSSSACLCNNPLAGGNSDDTTCCTGDNARIRIPVSPSNDPNSTEVNYLYTTCSLAQGAAEVYLTSDAPTTEAPVTAPSPTMTEPTDAPAAVTEPTDAPAETPITPTVSPSTLAPLPRTTPTPSAFPTTSPVTVTNLPTTQAPTTMNISLVPSVAPTSMPTIIATITAAPMGSALPPSSDPTRTFSTLAVYDIALSNGFSQIGNAEFVTEYTSNLIAAMNIVAGNVARTTTIAGNNTSSRLRRWIQEASILTVVVPTGLQPVQNISCPNTEVIIANSTLCQTWTANIGLRIPDNVTEQEEASLKSNFDESLFDSIRDGSLQTELDNLDWSNNNDENPVIVLTGLADVPIVAAPSSAPREIQGTDALSPGAIAGISLAGLFFFILPIGYYIFQRNRPLDDDYDDPNAPKPQYAEEYEADIEGDLANKSVADSSLVTDAAQGGGLTGPMVGATTLGASQAYYGKPPHDPAVVATGHDEPGMLLDDAADNDDEDDDNDDGAASSNAGSSGWSSSAGISSLNTGSVDEVDIAAAAGATLAGIGLASAFSRNLSKRDQDALATTTPSDTDDGGHSEAPSVSRDQLDSLIEAGDWAAVGATAALLAAASDSQSGTSISRGNGGGTAHSRSRDSQSVDAARAAELDHLVDAGDWEGVVAAAAKFEAQAESGTASGTGSGTGSRSSRTHSSVESSAGSGSNTGTGTNTAGSPSVATSLSDTASKAQKREEVKSEVEALVRRVAPEEIDNVDEMMNQFKGREEELVETLRTMQERAVAQKARSAGHRAAKTEARRSVQRIGSGTTSTPGSVVQKVASLEIKQAASGTGGMAAAGAGMGAAAVVTAGIVGTSKDDKDKKPAAQVTTNSKVVADARSALEDAIEAGDWEAVGEAAAMISDNSVTTISSAEIARLAGTNLSISTTGTHHSRSSLAGVNADRASELDALIELGDWSGVVAIANRFSDSDKQDMSETGGVRSKEEEEALKEAELWMKIADQKKAEGAMDAGASDAAEWAIQRSLSQLREAEKKTEKKQRRGDADDEDEV